MQRPRRQEMVPVGTSFDMDLFREEKNIASVVKRQRNDLKKKQTKKNLPISTPKFIYQ